ncbi:MAG TPA: hypothetical protein VK550_28245 [Polyangiaceae bacterium]|nr:hypothetical protein [Polyangiaceae bacterium]
MTTSSLLAIAANENATHLRLALVVTDPEVVHELVQNPEGDPRDVYAKQALRLGVLALRQASGALDAQTIQRESERMLDSVRQLLIDRTGQFTDGVTKVLGSYLDPMSGSLPLRLERLMQGGGELEMMLAKHVDGERSGLAQTLAQHVGQQSPLFKLLSPEQSDGLVATLEGTIQAALKAQADHVLQQFSLDRPDSALTRLLHEVTTSNGTLRSELTSDVKAITKEFSLDHEGSALNRLSATLDKTCRAVQTSLTLDDAASPLSRLRLELRSVLDALAATNAQFQTEVRTTLEGIKVRREEADRSPRHGNTFEANVGEFLCGEAKRLDDTYEAVGTLKGQADRKTGDHVLTLSPDSGAPGARIVCEAKARKAYTERAALEEIALARKNRDAQVGLVVMDRATAPEGLDVLRRVGQDILVVWDAEDVASDLNLRLAVSVARALCVRARMAATQDEANLEQIDSSIEAIANQIGVVDEIIRSAKLIKQRGEKVTTCAEKLRETLETEVAALQKHLLALRKKDGREPARIGYIK